MSMSSARRVRRPRFAERPFRMPIARPKPLGPEHNLWYWNPRNVEVQFAPDRFRRLIKDIDPKYEVTWSPIRERWLVFAEAPKINHKICRGWKLVFVVEDEGEYCPLDERVLAKAWDRSVRKWGSLGSYWNRIEQDIEHRAEKSAAERKDSIAQGANEYFDYMKIKNIGHGSKFANYGS